MRRCGGRRGAVAALLCAGLLSAVPSAASGAGPPRWRGHEFGPGRPLALAVDAGGVPWTLVTDASADAESPGTPLALQPLVGALDPVPDPEATRAGSIASDGPGRVVVAWLARSPSGRAVRVATYASGVWEAAVTLEAPSAATRREAPVLAAGPARSVVVWRAQEGAQTTIRASWRDSAAAAWTLPATIARGTELGAPRVGIDAAGDALVAWRRVAGGAGVWVSVLPAGPGGWSSPRPVGGAGAAGPPALAVGAGGDAILAWRRSGRAGVTVATGRLPRAPAAPRLLSAAARRASVAVGARGDAAVVIARGRRFLVATRAGRGRLGVPRLIPPSSRASPLTSGDPLPSVVIDRAGTATALWLRDLEGTYGVVARHPRGGAGWSRPRVAFEFFGGCGNCSPEFEPLIVAADDAGRAAAVGGWRDVDLTDDRRTRASLFTSPR